MAENKNIPAVPSTPVAGATPAPEQAPKKPRGETRQAVYKTLEEATKEAAGRAEGHRRVFTVKLTKDSKESFVIANHPHQACYFQSIHEGGVVDEQGKTSRASKPLTVDAIMASVNALPEAERKAVLEQFKALAKSK